MIAYTSGPLSTNVNQVENEKRVKQAVKAKMFCERLKSSFIPIHDAVKLALTTNRINASQIFSDTIEKNVPSYNPNWSFERDHLNILSRIQIEGTYKKFLTDKQLFLNIFFDEFIEKLIDMYTNKKVVSTACGDDDSSGIDGYFFVTFFQTIFKDKNQLGTFNNLFNPEYTRFISNQITLDEKDANEKIDTMIHMVTFFYLVRLYPKEDASYFSLLLSFCGSSSAVSDVPFNYDEELKGFYNELVDNYGRRETSDNGSKVTKYDARTDHAIIGCVLFAFFLMLYSLYSLNSNNV